MKILLVTGHENGGVRQRMADALSHLGDVSVQNVRRLRMGGAYDVIVFDTRFVEHASQALVKSSYPGARFVRVNNGSGGIARVVEMALAT